MDLVDVTHHHVCHVDPARVLTKFFILLVDSDCRSLSDSHCSRINVRSDVRQVIFGLRAIDMLVCSILLPRIKLLLSPLLVFLVGTVKHLDHCILRDMFLRPIFKLNVTHLGELCGGQTNSCLVFMFLVELRHMLLVESLTATMLQSEVLNLFCCFLPAKDSIKDSLQEANALILSHFLDPESTLIIDAVSNHLVCKVFRVIVDRQLSAPVTELGVLLKGDVVFETKHVFQVLLFRLEDDDAVANDD